MEPVLLFLEKTVAQSSFKNWVCLISFHPIMAFTLWTFRFDYDLWCLARSTLLAACGHPPLLFCDIYDLGLELMDNCNQHVRAHIQHLYWNCKKLTFLYLLTSLARTPIPVIRLKAWHDWFGGNDVSCLDQHVLGNFQNDFPSLYGRWKAMSAEALWLLLTFGYSW